MVNGKYLPVAADVRKLAAGGEVGVEKSLPSVNQHFVFRHHVLASQDFQQSSLTRT